MVYKIKCAWCGKILGSKECASNYMPVAINKNEGSCVTHSICLKCKEKVLNEIRNEDEITSPFNIGMHRPK
ncbi:conserved hypothetical protein [Desulfamplus magnetovallimortis]|uniref:Uncharacterized protein n=1 Tax=Desulfamplus magnetovallimortis TaxID=1246637 RepID=A0A1W1HAB9_9BACT|nr:hypothetical protein [Desulfamplus magnetovallimortis]SLM29379.1 conserved hypothetical protein [Desulfamplus magnetovallimortis]